jgi:hypothetical protein
LVGDGLYRLAEETESLKSAEEFVRLALVGDGLYRLTEEKHTTGLDK